MKRLTIALAVLAATAFAVAPVALAKHSSHRTTHAHKLAHWEHRFHFKLTKANALADADGDAVSNVGEFVDGTNPLSKDTNHNGRPDGTEDHNHNGVPNAQDTAATVTSFTAATATAPAVLVITLPDGTMETGDVTDATEIKCETAAVMTTPTTAATTRDHGGDNQGSGNQGSGNQGSGNQGSNDQGDQSGPGPGNGDQGANGSDDGGGAQMCTTDALTVGTIVHAAELRITSAGPVFKELELIK